MREFRVRAPDTRLLPRQAETLRELKESLVEGYEVAYEVFDGIMVAPLPDRLTSYSLMAYLLRQHGDELLAWMATNGIQFVDEKAARGAVAKKKK